MIIHKLKCHNKFDKINTFCAVFSNKFVNLQVVAIVCAGLNCFEPCARNSNMLVKLQVFSIIRATI